MIRRHKTTIFTDAKESTTVYELKRIVEGILKRPPEDQRLYKVGGRFRGDLPAGKTPGSSPVYQVLTLLLPPQDDLLLNDAQTLGNCGFTNQTARPQAPATVGLAFRLGGESPPPTFAPPPDRRRPFFTCFLSSSQMTPSSS